MSFQDATPVRLSVDLTAGELKALIDDPIMLQDFGPGAYYATVKQSAIRKLAAARDSNAKVETGVTATDSIHVDVCPDCGEPAVRHMLDAVGFCTHLRECYVPVEYVPAKRADDLRATVQNVLDAGFNYPEEYRDSLQEALDAWSES